MKEILLGNGGSVLVDDADFEWLSRWRWTRLDHKECKGSVLRYAVRSERRGGRSAPKVVFYMHREILGAPKGSMVDHMNGNGLDNQRCNLRLCTGQGNQRNKRKTRGRSRFKGLCWMPSMRQWQVQITVANRKIFVGYSRDEETAARMYDEAARKHHGAFACVNFPRPGEHGALAA